MTSAQPRFPSEVPENGARSILHRLGLICDVITAAAADESLLVQLCAAICRHSDWTICAILGVERETGTNHLLARYDPFENTPRETNWQLRGSPVQQVLATAAPFVLQDVDRSEIYPAFAADAQRRGYTTLVIAPLVIASDEPLHYCLSLKRSDRSEVSATELDFIQSLSRLIATVVRRADAFHHLAQSLREVQTASALQADLAGLAATEETLEDLAARLTRLPLPPMLLHELMPQRSIPVGLDSSPTLNEALWKRQSLLRDDAVTFDLPDIGPMIALPLTGKRLLGALVMRQSDRVALADDVARTLQLGCTIVLEREQAQADNRQELCEYLLRRALEDFSHAGPTLDNLREAFGLDLRKGASLVAIKSASGQPSAEELADHVLAGLRSVTMPPAVTRLDGTVWLVCGPDRRATRGMRQIIDDLVALEAQLLIARCDFSEEGLRLPAAITRCQQLLDFASLRGLRGEISDDGVGNSALLLATLKGETAKSFVRSMLGPMVSDDTDRTTLRVFLALNGNFARTAEELGIHVTTLRYRLEKMRGRGLDLDDPEKRFALMLALHISTLHPDKT